MRVRSLAGWLVLTAVVGICAWLLRESWPVIVEMLTGARWHLLVGSVALLAFGNVQIGQVFVRLVGRSSPAETREARVLGVFLVSQVGKYVPGRIWGVAMQASMLRGAGSTNAVIWANVELAVLVLVIVLGTAVASLAGWIHGFWMTAVALVATWGGCALLLKLDIFWRSIAVLSGLTPRIARLAAFASLGREGEPARVRHLAAPTYMNLAAYMASYCAGWMLLVEGVTGTGARDGLAVVAALSLSYIAGVLSMLPGGLGAREGTMILLAPAFGLGHGDMGAVAVVSRAALLLVDVIAATLGILLTRQDLLGGRDV